MARITKVMLLISLMSFIRTQNIRVKTSLSKEQTVSNESKQTLQNSEQINEDLLKQDPTSTQVLELINEHISQKKILSKKHSKNTSSTTKLNASLFQNKIKNLDNSESDEDEQNSEHSSDDTDLIDDRPNLDGKAEFKLKKNLQTTEIIKAKLQYFNNDYSDTRPVRDDDKTSERFGRNDLIDTRPSKDDEVTENHKKYVQNLKQQKKYYSNINTIKNEKKHSKPNVNKQKVIHTTHSMVSDHNFAYMAAILKGGSFVCAGALIDENWVLTAANGIHLMRETIRLLRIRLGSINFKKEGTLLPIKYFETHPYFNSSKPDYDLALLMLSKPVRYTMNIRGIGLQLTPKDVTATHFIMTSWQSAVRPGLNQSTVEVIKHNRILSVAHLHPTDPEDCLQELREVGAGSDGVMCLEGGAGNSCLRDTGAPVVINGVLWGIISSWKPQECDDEVSTFATLVSGRNIGNWLHATIHGHRWHPE